MRIYLFLTIILVGGILAAAGAQAFVSTRPTWTRKMAMQF